MPTVHQRSARAKALTRPTRPADPAGARSRLDSYVPDDTLARPHAGLLRGLAAAADPVDATDAGELLSALAGHAASLAAAGVAVTAETVLDPARVERWVLVGLAALSSGTAGNYRTRIARVAAAGDPRRLAPVHASDPAQPFTVAEEDQQIALCTGQRTARIGQNLLAVLCLGFGAGLSTAEIVETYGTDVTLDVDGNVLVFVTSARDRAAPVRRRYAETLLGLAQETGDTPLFNPGAAGRLGKNAVTNLVTESRHGADPTIPRLTPQRMRATWLVRHLDAGVRADVLMACAGLTDLGTLDRYVRWLAPVDSQAAINILGGTR